MKKISQKAAALFTIFFLFVFLTATILRSKGQVSYHENRKLAAIPEITFSGIADGSYFAQLGDFFADQFAGRSKWTSLKASLDAEIGESIVNGVYIKGDMLLDISEKLYSEKIEADEINKFVDSYEGAVYFAAVPSSSGVYSEFLPDYMDKGKEKSQIDSLYEILDPRIKKIDAYNILKMQNDNYIYYRSDSKWTGYGAYCVYRTVIQKLGFQPTEYDKYTIEHVSGDFLGNLYNKSQYKKIKADMLDIYTYPDGAEVLSCTGINEDGTEADCEIYNREFINSNNMYRLYLGNDIPLINIKTSLKNDRKLLVIKNDYADCFIPFLIQHFSEISIVSPECLNTGMSGLLNQKEYSQTLFLFGIDEFPDSSTLSMINK